MPFVLCHVKVAILVVTYNKISKQNNINNSKSYVDSVHGFICAQTTLYNHPSHQPSLAYIVMAEQ